MLRLHHFAVALAALTGARADFKKPCDENWDVCGWALQATYGYDSQTLSEATSFAGQDATVGTYIYDSIYNCFADGEIGWSAWCGGAGKCNPAPNSHSHAMCSGEPVDTGSEGDGGGSSEGDEGGGGEDGDVPWDDPDQPWDQPWNGDGGDGGDGDGSDVPYIPDQPIHG
ncbi:hypothetical protein VTK73DRAFT_9102 [Phialemonium thermophilum]|uniref:Uncharacterized protein n=1 Tax=Phialemonium thermophilum TaxID=223376 RepID=A0ABR3XLL4_9PEZI